MASWTERKREPIQIRDMMARLGIDPRGGVVPRLSLHYAAAFRGCEPCPSKKTCRDWLDHSPAAVSVVPPFCPSADILSELQFDQLGRSSI
jgi:Family of unknown function (DUF6455)